MSAQQAIHGYLAVGVAFLSLVACAFHLQSFQFESAELAFAKEAVTTETLELMDPDLTLFVNADKSQLLSVSGHHWYGYCGSAHFFRFQYTDDSRIRQLIKENGFESVSPSPASEDLGSSSEVDWISSDWNAGLGAGSTWTTYAQQWHRIPLLAAVYFSRVDGGHRCYLFVDGQTKTAYLEVNCGLP